MEIVLPGPNGPMAAQFDDEDAHLFANGEWRIQRYGKKYYVRSNIGGKNRLAHRVLLGLEDGDGVVSDHKNGDSLDNRKENLRACTNQQNLWNRRLGSKTGFVGVAPHRDGRFVGKVRQDGRYYYCGLHATAEQAAQAVNTKLKELRGEFASYNSLEG